MSFHLVLKGWYCLKLVGECDRVVRRLVKWLSTVLLQSTGGSCFLQLNDRTLVPWRRKQQIHPNVGGYLWNRIAWDPSRQQFWYSCQILLSSGCDKSGVQVLTCVFTLLWPPVFCSHSHSQRYNNSAFSWRRRQPPFPSEFFSAHILDSKLFLCVEARVNWIVVLQKFWKEWLVGMGQLLPTRVPCGTFGQPWRWERLGNDRSWLTLCSQGQNSSNASFGDLAFLLCHVAGMVDTVLPVRSACSHCYVIGELALCSQNKWAQ